MAGRSSAFSLLATLPYIWVQNLLWLSSSELAHWNRDHAEVEGASSCWGGVAACRLSATQRISSSCRTLPRGAVAIDGFFVAFRFAMPRAPCINNNQI